MAGLVPAIHENGRGQFLPVVFMGRRDEPGDDDLMD
jgi:hypothetical protein